MVFVRMAPPSHTTNRGECQVATIARWGLAAAMALIGCGEVGAGGTDAATDAGADGGCAWGRCASGPRCVATGIADGRWLTAEWDEAINGLACSMVPEALRDAATPGRYAVGAAPIGEIRCEGLRPGAATLRVRLRVRLLAGRMPGGADCGCGAPWDVGVRVVIDGQPARGIDGLMSVANSEDPSCRRGPDVDQALAVTVGADGGLEARVELGRCTRYGETACLFARGTGLSVEQ